MVVRKQDAVTEVNSISPQAPEGLGLCAQAHQVVKHFPFGGGFSYLQSSLGNANQILLP